MRIKNRRKKLYQELELELSREIPEINFIMQSIDEYEENNLDTIKRLKKEKKVTTNKIKGAIKQFLNVHPVLTKELIGSLTKRIIGAVLINEKKLNLIQRFGKWLFKL